MKIKLATTPIEQIDILRSKNVIVSDTVEAQTILENMSYYRLKGYLLPFKTELGYSEISFEKLVHLVRFDQLLRSWIMQYTEHIEITLRAFIIRALAFECSGNGKAYYDASYFNDEDDHVALMNAFNNAVIRSDELYVTHYNEKYDGEMPIWVAIETFTFGMLSRFYENLKPLYQNRIASYYPIRIHCKTILTSLRALTYLRNKCAHYNRIYFRVFNKFPMPKKWYNTHHIEYSNKRLYPLLHVMKDLCAEDRIWDLHLLDLAGIIEQHSFCIQLEHLGLPVDWIEELSI